MNRHFLLYSTATGIFTGEAIDIPEQFVEVALPIALEGRAGIAAKEGVFDALSQRVDTVTGEVVDYVPEAPPATADYTFAWNSIEKRWLPVETLSARQRRARTAIDFEAGQARLRFITSVPGQEGTYLVKAEQSEAFKAAGYAGAVPPFVQAEADATGTSPQQAADAILAQRDAWQTVAGPTIERLRRQYKLEADAAIAKADVDAIEAAALAALRAITP